MEKHKASRQRIIDWIEPARRHKCEICEQVFECHLCEIGRANLFHHGDHPMLRPTTMVFICEECCESTSNRFQPRIANDGAILHWVDMLTGEAVKEKGIRRET